MGTQATESSNIICRQPEIYKYPENFDLWVRRFLFYADTVKCEAKEKWPLLLNFVDGKAFRLLESIAWTDAEKTSRDTDLSTVLPKLKKALVIAYFLVVFVINLFIVEV